MPAVSRGCIEIEKPLRLKSFALWTLDDISRRRGSRCDFSEVALVLHKFLHTDKGVSQSGGLTRTGSNANMSGCKDA